MYLSPNSEIRTWNNWAIKLKLPLDLKRKLIFNIQQYYDRNAEDLDTSERTVNFMKSKEQSLLVITQVDSVWAQKASTAPNNKCRST